MDIGRLDLILRSAAEDDVSFLRSPEYIAVSRMIERYAYLILQTPTSSETLDTELASLQTKTQIELHNLLPFHRTQWLRNVESVRKRLLALEQSVQQIKSPRTRKNIVRDLSQKRATIRKLCNRIEEIGRNITDPRYSKQAPVRPEDDKVETMYDVLQQIRADKAQANGHVRVQGIFTDNESTLENRMATTEPLSNREQLFDSSLPRRRKPEGSEDDGHGGRAKTSGYSQIGGTEEVLMKQSQDQNDIIADTLSLTKQLKANSVALQDQLGREDKDLIDRAIEGLEQNSAAMNIASKGMKTLTRMSESESWLQRLKLQLMIVALWFAAILLVFAGPKLRF